MEIGRHRGLRALTALAGDGHTTPNTVHGATQWQAQGATQLAHKRGRAVKNKEIWLELSYLMATMTSLGKRFGRDREPANQRAAQLARREAENVKQGQ
jgi:ribonuclease HI